MALRQRRGGEPGVELLGIVVGTTDLGESDRVVRLLTEERGRVAVVVRRARSKSGSATDLGVTVRVVVGRARDGLYPASAIDGLRAPVRARSSLDRIALLSWGAEWCASLSPEDAPATRLWRLLGAWMDLLEGEAPVTVAHRLGFEAKALTFGGFTPALARCSRCAGQLDDPTVFDAETGGGAHARCGGGAPIRVAALAHVDDLRRTALADIRGPAPDLPPMLLADFAEHHLGRGFASRGLLALAC